MSQANLKRLLRLQAALEAKQLKGRIIEDLHDGQKKFILEPGDDGVLPTFNCLLSARRFGKTEGVLRYFGDLCQRKGRARCIGIYQLAAHAREVAWPILQELHFKYKWEAKLNSVELAVRFKNSSVIKLAGADDARRHRQFRGQRNDAVLIDEGQDWYSDLEQLINWITPGLADRKGRLFLCGTPGILPEGYFFEVCRGDHPQWKVLKVPAFANPYTAPQLKAQLEILKKANPKAEDLPWVQREFFGKWVTDTRKNIVHVDPALNYLTQWNPEQDDHYVLGIDWGDDNCAMVVGTWNKRRYPWLIYIEAEVYHGLKLKDHLAAIHKWQAKYPTAMIVADPGGLSKTITRELKETHGIPIINAVKENKLAQIEFMNADLGLGNIKIHNRNQPDRPDKSLVAKQWRELIWIDDKQKGTRQEGRPRDIHDACLYVRRHAYHHLWRPEVEAPPSIGTQKWAIIEARRMRQAKERQVKKRSASNWR